VTPPSCRRQECCVLEYVFSLSLKEDLRTLRPIEIGIFSTYLYAHMPKINSSYVKILQKRAKFPQSSHNLVSKKSQYNVWLIVSKRFFFARGNCPHSFFFLPTNLPVAPAKTNH
jgi:hypothetical protein